MSRRDHLPCYNDVQICSVTTREMHVVLIRTENYLFRKYVRGSGRGRVPNIVPVFDIKFLESWLRKLLL
jgi:hypothetical protein